MMKKYSFVPVVLVGSVIAQYFGPWWSMPIVCAAAAYYFALKKGVAYAIGFSTIFVLWYALALYSDTNFDTPMSSVLGAVFGNISSSLVYTLTAFIGGLCAGFASLCGAWARDILSPTQSQ